jgi:hypothetical protein
MGGAQGVRRGTIWYDRAVERPGCLIISDGGVTSLLACGAAADRSRAGAGSPASAIWVASAGSEGGSDIRASAERQAELFGFELVAEPGVELPAGEVDRVAEVDVLRLLRAGLIAARRGLAQVIVPANAGAELSLDETGRIIDRVLLVSRLVSLEVGSAASPVMVAPYADLTDAQIADLILDMDLPIWTCWWWGGASAEAAAERERWTVAMRKAGWKGPLPGPEIVAGRAVSGRPVAP